MRIKLKRNEATGQVEVTITDALLHDGQVAMTFQTHLVPIVEIDDGVQAEVFIPSTADIYSAKDHDKIAPRPLLSVWRGKLPTNRR